MIGSCVFLTQSQNAVFGQGCCSLVEHLPSMCTTLDSLPSAAKQKKKEKKRWNLFMAGVEIGCVGEVTSHTFRSFKTWVVQKKWPVLFITDQYQ